METLEFIRKLHRGGGWSYWWTSIDKKSKWWPIDEPAPLPDDRNVDIYFGVNACRQIPRENAEGEPKKPDQVRAQIKHIQQVSCLFAEFDQKDFEGENYELHLNKLFIKIPPSVIINSGGGHHCYWMLDEPCRDIEMIGKLQAEWVKFVGGDEGSKDLARVLRVPGTKNYKYTPPRDVFIFAANDNEYSIERLQNVMVAVEIKDRDRDVEIVDAIEEDAVTWALMYLGGLSNDRCENYQQWLEVGMALSHLGEIGLKLWDNWSKKSPKYKWGICAQKWRTFTPDDGLTVDSLRFWASEDNPDELFTIPQSPKRPKPSNYKTAMLSAGWEFKLNISNEDIELNGMRLNENLFSVVHNAMRERGYKSMPIVDDSMRELALKNRYHPIVDYLERLEWDGEDHIEKLANYFKGEHGVFEQWLTRWLIGAIARVSEIPRGQQNRMLVLDGRQNIGKSYFVRWLANDIPSFHMEGPISPDDKDDDIRLMSMWIWEVAELGSTFRKSDREALKFFISKEKVRVRKSYGRMDTERPAMSSFIGTINNEAGFLSDPTGSRRFMVESLSDIDWNYATEVDPGQVWARAYHLYKKGEPWNLVAEEAIMASEINAEYEIEEPLAEYVLWYFIVDPSDDQHFTTTATIVDCLKTNGHITGSQRAAAMKIGSLLKKWGCQKHRRMEDGKQSKGWKGVKRRTDQNRGTDKPENEEIPM